MMRSTCEGTREDPTLIHTFTPAFGGAGHIAEKAFTVEVALKGVMIIDIRDDFALDPALVENGLSITT